MDGSCSDDSEIEEERAGGRAQPAEGRSRRTGGRIRADDVYPECWRSIHLSDDGGDTLRASGHCMCDLHMHMGRYDQPEVVLTLFRSIRFQVMPLNRRFNQRIKGSATSVVASSFELNLASPRHPDLTACSSGNQDCKTIPILAAA
jgi:hypothetical protein